MAIRLRKLHDQVMVITGATSGIGLATARRFAAEGAKVFVTGRREAEAALGGRGRAGEQCPQGCGAGVGEADDAAVGDEDASAAVEAQGPVEREPHTERPPSIG